MALNKGGDLTILTKYRNKAINAGDYTMVGLIDTLDTGAGWADLRT